MFNSDKKLNNKSNKNHKDQTEDQIHGESHDQSKDESYDKYDYEVGYQKPPKATQFAKGHSGNPNGRPKGTKNWAISLHAALSQTVTVLVNGSSKQVSKLEAATTQLANKATQGDLHSIRLLFQLMPGMEATLSKTGTSALSNEQDNQILKVFLQRMSQPNIEVIGVANPNHKEGGAS